MGDEEFNIKIGKLSLISVLMVFTLVSNFCGILALIRRKTNAGGKLTRMYFFLLHLFVADIIVAFSSLLPELIVNAVSGSHFLGGDVLCKLMKFVQMFGPYLRYVNYIHFSENQLGYNQIRRNT